jgi:hypothetical protein
MRSARQGAGKRAAAPRGGAVASGIRGIGCGVPSGHPEFRFYQALNHRHRPLRASGREAEASLLLTALGYRNKEAY